MLQNSLLYGLWTYFYYNNIKYCIIYEYYDYNEEFIDQSSYEILNDNVLSEITDTFMNKLNANNKFCTKSDYYLKKDYYILFKIIYDNQYKMFQYLPNELSYIILNSINRKQLILMSRICKKFYSLDMNSLLIKRKFEGFPRKKAKVWGISENIVCKDKSFNNIKLYL